MEKLLQVARQRIDALISLQEKTQGIRKNIVEAGQSQADFAAKQSDVQAAEAWSAIRARDAFARGKAQGYAAACQDVLGVIDSISAAISGEGQSLQELFDKMNSFEESEEVSEGEDLVPLDLSESTTDSDS
tara:strand:- start:1046 stop:1438 length:393 start_codon:yes stop_codon:yes gene_type:complete